MNTYLADGSLGDATIPSAGYLLSLWVGIFFLSVMAVANVVLVVTLRRQLRAFRAEIPNHFGYLWSMLHPGVQPSIPGPTQGRGQGITPTPPR